MRLLRYSLLALCVLLPLVLAADAQAEIGWAGNVWPLHNSSQIPTGPITVYAQVWKGGVTDAGGQGAGISATLYYKTDLVGTDTSVPMVYNTDVGGNDEYMGDVPQSALAGAAWVEVHVVFTDDTDGTSFSDVKDQSNQGPPQRYNITQVLPNDVAVTFTLCMSGTATTAAPCVIGNQAPIGNWGTGVSMTNVSGELWTVAVTFPAGSSPALEYKYKADGCTNWEGDPNRSVTLPTDGTTAVTLPTDSYNRAAIGCGLGAALTEDKVVCLQVCMTGVQAPPVCATGSIAQLTNWGNGAAMTMVGVDLYQVCLSFPAGTAIPVNVEYKYRKDGCNTWEGVGNRTFTVDNGSPKEQTITRTWDDGAGACATVGTQRSSWGRLKSLYR